MSIFVKSVHSHAVEENLSSTGYDWRDDRNPGSQRAKADPWKQIYEQKADAEPSEGTNEETYSPQDWHKTEDPELSIKYFRAQLIKQFGDIKEVHIIADREEKRKFGSPVTLDEQIVFLEAQYSLWSNTNTLKTLEKLRKIKADTHNQEH